VTDNYKLEKSIVTIPYTPNRDDRIDLTFTEFAEVFGLYDILNTSGAQTGTIPNMYII
tara:strand:+ start:50 stop:223 length:174 start_codon:yes stop_codon:yes gene_type:complete